MTRDWGPGVTQPLPDEVAARLPLALREEGAVYTGGEALAYMDDGDPDDVPDPFCDCGRQDCDLCADRRAAEQDYYRELGRDMAREDG